MIPRLLLVFKIIVVDDAEIVVGLGVVLVIGERLVEFFDGVLLILVARIDDAEVIVIPFGLALQAALGLAQL